MTNKLTTFSGTITVITSMLGVGINFMPSSFGSIGYMSSILVMVLMSVLTAFSLFCVSFAAYASEDKNVTYPSIAYEKNKHFGLFVDISILLNQFCLGIAFHKYLVQLLIQFIYQKEQSALIKCLFLSGTGVFLFYLCLLKDLSSLKFTSYLSVFCVFYLTVLMFVYTFFFGDLVQEGGFDRTRTNYGHGLGKMILAMCCQVNMPKIFSELENQSIGSILIISTLGSVIGGLIYSLVGFFGYKLLGNSIGKEDLMKIFSTSSSNIHKELEGTYLKYTPHIAVFGAIFVLMGSFPLQVNPATLILQKLLNKHDECSRKKLVSVLFGSMLLLNFLDLDLSTILNVLGAIFSNAIAFIFPALYYILAIKRFNVLSLLSGILICASIVAGGYILMNLNS
ncbi:amino acid permease [Vairimorpha apis BRL 01]|uniref:Amino acid permease n=1 Tax=Vairimorpha apis BRL 01 TaxID=1037528 RepID=T0L715_9MICR|nr:amino acid permease [Vairimorpha apis BRL 01]